ARAQDRTVANAAMQRAFKSMHRGPGSLHPERGITARQFSSTGIEHVVAQHNILARNILLIGASAVIAPHDSRVGGRPLRPISPAICKGEWFCGVITRGQASDEGEALPGYRVHADDA